MVPHPAAALDMAFGRRLDPLARQPQPLPQRVRITLALMVCRPIRPAPPRRRHAAAPGATETPPPHCRSTRRRTRSSDTSNSRRITATGPVYLKLGNLDLPRRRCTRTSPLVAAAVSVPVAAMWVMKPSPTDINPLPHRWRNLLPLTGLTRGQVHTVYTLTRQRLPPAPGRPWSLPPAVRVLLVLIHLRTNLTTRAPGRAVSHQPIGGRPDHPPPGPGAGPSAAARSRRPHRKCGTSMAPSSRCTTTRSPR